MKRVVFLRRLSDRVLEGLSVFLLLLIENVGGDERACGPFLTLGHLEKDVQP